MFLLESKISSPLAILGVTIMNKSFCYSTKAFASYQELKEYLKYHKKKGN
jgi:hypothetical protein